MIVADDLGATLDAPGGQSLQRARAASGLFAETLEQWSDLADRLDLSPADAARALFGERAVYVSESVSPPAIDPPNEKSAWAIITWIPAEAEKRVRNGLDLAPRGKIAGQLVLASEQGRFSLAMLATKTDTGANQTILLLAPATNNAMLEPIIRSLVGAEGDRPPNSIGSRPAFKHLRQVGAGVLNVFAAPDDSFTLALAAHETKRGWSADVRVDAPGNLTERFGVRPVDREQFDALAPGAIALIMESGPDRVHHGENKAALTSLSMFADVPERFFKLLGGRFLLMAERAGAGDDGLAITLASEATYPGDAVAEGDRAINTLISPGSGSAPPEGAIEGEYPLAVRTASPSVSSPAVMGDDVQIRWGYSAPDAGTPRWWAMRIAPEASHPQQSVRALADALATSQPGAASSRGRQLWMGVLRPSSMLDALGGTSQTAIPPTIQAFTWVERLAWEVRLDTDNPGVNDARDSVHLSATLELEMRPVADGRLGAP